MATALPHNTNQECSICFERFRTPKILTCGHSFCLECLVKYIDDRKGTIPCPVCKTNVKVPRGGVDKFITNFDLQTSADFLRTIDISTTQTSKSLKSKQYCPNHSKKEVEYYCQTCNLGLCTKCILKDHVDHKYLDLECDSSREMVVQKLSKSSQIIKLKIKDLEKTYATLLETSKKLKSFCDEACTKIIEKNEKIIGELKENCEKIHKEIRNHLDKNESKLTGTRQQVMTQIKNIKTDLDIFCPTTTEEPSLTLVYSLTKLQDLQKLCENMKTVIPPVTYVEWREGSVKVCDMFGSTVTKPLYQSSEGSGSISTVTKTLYQFSEGSVFRFNYKDINLDKWNFSKDKYKYTSYDIVWGCKVVMSSYEGNLHIQIWLPPEDNPRLDVCEIKYTVTIVNKDKDKNKISKTRTRRIASGGNFGIYILWNTLTDPSEGFIDKDGHFLVRFDILQVSEYIRLSMSENFAMVFR